MNGIGNVVNRELAALFGDLRIENDLKQEITSSSRSSCGRPARASSTASNASYASSNIIGASVA
jgi:hypothetical protein